jgi:hypothetical protein
MSGLLLPSDLAALAGRAACDRYDACRRMLLAALIVIAKYNNCLPFPLTSY